MGIDIAAAAHEHEAKQRGKQRYKYLFHLRAYYLGFSEGKNTKKDAM